MNFAMPQNYISSQGKSLFTVYATAKRDDWCFKKQFKSAWEKRSQMFSSLDTDSLSCTFNVTVHQPDAFVFS